MAAVACTDESGDGHRTSGGARECMIDAECLATAEARVAGLMTPATYQAQATVASCQQASIFDGSAWIQGPACQCQNQGGGVRLIGPSGLPCSLGGRAGACLWDTTTFPACDQQPASFCADVCADVEARLAADFARGVDASVRLARCGAVYCEIVLRVEDRCYAGVALGTAYDCALTDEQILAAAGR
jgi:hypothetical protein